MRPTVLLDLIDNLSPSAALWRAIDPDVVWDLQATLTALLIDEIRVLRWEFERVYFKGKTRPPDPIPRPGAAPPSERTVERVGASEGFDTIAEFDAWYAGVQASRTEVDTRGRAMPPRDEQGRFVSQQWRGIVTAA